MIGAAIAATAGEDRRGTDRRVVNLAAHLRDGDIRVVAVQVTDLCADGCRLSGDLNLEQATRVWLRIPGITPRPARVAWTKRDEAGCTFDHPISEAVLDEAWRDAR